MSENEDKVFLAKLKSAKLLTEAEVSAVVNAYEQLKKAGESVHLTDVFLNKGVLNSQQIKSLRNTGKEIKAKSLGDYELKEKLGAGGMGAVYLGMHKESKKLFAIKVLSKANGNSEKAVARFDREFSALTKLNHKNIIGGIEKGFSNGYHFYVMDYFEGESLKEKAKKIKKDDFSYIARLVLDIAKGLQYAQSLGFIHRDIKPDNIFITKHKDEVKIIDFGLVKSESEDSLGLTQSQTAMGTPHFISCEQAKDAKRADLRSDIYSLGATFYYLITKQFPVKGSTAFEILSALISEEVTEPIKLDENIPQSVNAVVMHMMAKDAADRYQDYDSLIEDLKLISKGRPVSREFSSTIMTKSPGVSKRTTSSRLIFSGVLVVSLMVGLYLTLSGGSPSTVDHKTLPDDAHDVLGDVPLVEGRDDGHVPEKTVVVKEVFKAYSISEKFFFAEQRKQHHSSDAHKINKLIDRLNSWLVSQPIQNSTSNEEILMAKGMVLLALHGSGEDYVKSDHLALMNQHLDQLLKLQEKKSSGGWAGSVGLDVVCAQVLIEALALGGATEENGLEDACRAAHGRLKSIAADLKVPDFDQSPLGVNGLMINLLLARYSKIKGASLHVDRKVVRSLRQAKVGLGLDGMVYQLITRNPESFNKAIEGLEHELKNKRSKTAKDAYLSFLIKRLYRHKKIKLEGIKSFGWGYFYEGKDLKSIPYGNDFSQFKELNGRIITNALAVLALQNNYKYGYRLRMGGNTGGSHKRGPGKGNRRRNKHLRDKALRNRP